MAHWIPDSSNLKEEYNKNFREKIDRWSLTDRKKNRFIASKLCRHLERLGKPLNGLRALDVGCAKGYFTEALREQGFEAEGLDYSDVAIEIAEKLFPGCRFYCRDGFKPELEKSYDLIFMKGFSGTNTHNLPFVKELCNRYLDHLNEGGWFILAYSTNFSGREAEGETVNWSPAEIEELGRELQADYLGFRYFDETPLKSIAKSVVRLYKRELKRYIYMIFRKS